MTESTTAVPGQPHCALTLQWRMSRCAVDGTIMSKLIANGTVHSLT